MGISEAHLPTWFLLWSVAQPNRQFRQPKKMFKNLYFNLKTFNRICCIVEACRNVTVHGSASDSKSTVIPNGMPISSVRAYRRPMEPVLSSYPFLNLLTKLNLLTIFELISRLVSSSRTAWMMGSSRSLALMGNIEHFIGAIIGGNSRYCKILKMFRMN